MKSLSETKTALRQKGHRLLLASILLMILASPFLSVNPTFSWLLDVFLILVLLAAARTVAGPGLRFKIVLVLGLAALLSQLALLGTQWGWLATSRYVATPLFLFWVSGMLLRDIVSRSHTVTAELILGAVNVYLMIGVGFAFIYGLIELLQPGSFAGLEELASTPDRMLYFLYFSFITMSTLGYGDISPLTPHGMTATYIEAIFGQMYLAILVARLVAMYIDSRRKEQP
jgi:membrane-associated HD superfamily phosphohydrolase